MTQKSTFDLTLLSVRIITCFEHERGLMCGELFLTSLYSTTTRNKLLGI